jgi:predicted DNA-binding protein (UPF0251 family)
MRGSYRKRRVDTPPEFYHFKPAGVPRKQLKKMHLTLDEFEALRLADLLNHDHYQAAEQMAISRPTFSRLIEKARHKVAASIVHGRELIITGGNVEFKRTHCRCNSCGSEALRTVTNSNLDCPKCGSHDVHNSLDKFKNS